MGSLPAYDPEVFPDPEAFNPQRWLKDRASSKSDSKESKAVGPSQQAPANTLEGLMNFSVGPRVCIGEKFAKIEGVAFLTHLLREWKIEPALRVGETLDGWRTRVLQPRFVMTLILDDVPVRFVRRAAA